MIGRIRLPYLSKIDRVIDTKEGQSTVCPFAISPDEKYAVYISGIIQSAILVQLDGVIIKELSGYASRGPCDNRNIVISPDSKYVAIPGYDAESQTVSYIILDSKGTKLAELPNQELNALIPELSNNAKGDFILTFNFSPDSKKMFFVSQFSSEIDADTTKNVGRYGFIGDADGKNIKIVTGNLDDDEVRVSGSDW